MHRSWLTTTLAFVAILGTRTLFAQHAGMPAGMTHEEHLAQMKKEAELKRRGAEAMGFDPDKTTHHFRLTTEGGVISVAANSPDDRVSRDQIRTHLTEIAAAFAEGHFAKPEATHGEVPPGVETMRRVKAAIRYSVEELPAGGAVHLVTADPVALAAIHEFLAYQIREHQTGDPLEVQQSQPRQEPQGGRH
jgi:hypothetical protein